MKQGGKDTTQRIKHSGRPVAHNDLARPLHYYILRQRSQYEYGGRSCRTHIQTPVQSFHVEPVWRGGRTYRPYKHPTLKAVQFVYVYFYVFNHCMPVVGTLRETTQHDQGLRWGSCKVAEARYFPPMPRKSLQAPNRRPVYPFELTQSHTGTCIGRVPNICSP